MPADDYNYGSNRAPSCFGDGKYVYFDGKNNWYVDNDDIIHTADSDDVYDCNDLPTKSEKQKPMGVITHNLEMDLAALIKIGQAYVESVQGVKAGTVVFATKDGKPLNIADYKFIFQKNEPVTRKKAKQVIAERKLDPEL